MAMKPDDQEIAALYRETGNAGPSAELDRAILQAAHAAVAPRPAAAGWRRWRLSIPVLASLLMVGLFALLLSLEPPPAPGIGRIALNEAAPPAAPTASRPVTESAAPAPAARSQDSAPPRAAAKMAVPARPAGEAEPAATTGSAAEAPAGTAAPVQAKAEARAAAPASPARQAPGEWLAAIQQLIDKERLDEARASLKAFRQAYPGEAVPAAMDKRLKP